MKAEVTWVDGMRFLGRSESGHSVVMDARPEVGGSNTAPSPMEMVLMALGGCSGIDVVSILKKGRQAVRDCSVHLNATRADAVPAVFTHLHAHYVVSGDNLDPAKVERAVKLSAEKYCSVSIMLGEAVEITHDFEVVHPAD